MSLLSWPSTAIMEKLRIASVEFYLGRANELSRSSKMLFRKNLGDSLWMATMSTDATFSHDEALEVMALINTMEDQLESFYVWNPVRPYPKYDFDGSKYGASEPVVLAKASNNKEFSISGFVSGYTVSRGDFLAIPSRHVLVQAVSASVSANGSSQTGLIEVTPFLDPDVDAGDVVVVIKPYVEVIIVPGQDVRPHHEGAFAQLQFDVIQVPNANT